MARFIEHLNIESTSSRKSCGPDYVDLQTYLCIRTCMRQGGLNNSDMELSTSLLIEATWSLKLKILSPWRKNLPFNSSSQFERFQISCSQILFPF